MRKERPIQNNGGPKEKDLPQSRADRLETTLNEVLAAVRRQSSRSSSLNDDAGDLVDSFHRIALAIDRLVSRHSAVDAVSESNSDVSRLARALLITGNGARLEQCVLHAIREYRIADENLKRYQSADLPEPLKTDLLARFSQQMDSCQQSLELLQVKVFEPAVSEPVDPKRHRVTRRVKSESEQSRDLIAEVISPGFEWINDEGAVRIVPSYVAVSVFEQPNRWPSSDAMSKDWFAPGHCRDGNQVEDDPLLFPSDTLTGDV